MTMTHPTTIHAAPKVRRVRVYPRLSLAIRKRLTEYCARKGVAERDIIEDAILQVINQMTRLNWSDIIKEDMAESVVSIDSLLSGLDSDTERQLGICMVPMYSVSADEVDNVKSSSSLDPARQLLERLGVWEYFFPDGESLALGLVDRGFDEPQKLEEAIVLAPKNGHLINEREEVPKLDALLANLQAKGLVGEFEAKLKVDIGGQKVRATVKIKPQEALLVKLKQLASLAGPITKLAGSSSSPGTWGRDVSRVGPLEPTGPDEAPGNLTTSAHGRSTERPCRTTRRRVGPTRNCSWTNGTSTNRSRCTSTI
jgi:hypothetical protein